MSNYIKSEAYQLRHNKNLLVTQSILAALVVGGICLFKYLSAHLGGRNIATFSMLYTSMSAVFWLVMILAAVLENYEHTHHHTIKNSVSFGISRPSIYLGRFLCQAVVCTLTYVVLAALYMGLTCLILGIPSQDEFSSLYAALAGAYPLLICAFSVCYCIFINMGSGWTGAFACLGILWFLPVIFHYLGLKFPVFSLLYKWSPLTMLGRADDSYVWETVSGMGHCYFTGVVGTLMFIGIGLWWFTRREIR